MSFTEKKKEEIKKYIMRKITLDDKEFIVKTMDNFEISITSVKRYLQEMISSNAIEMSDQDECGYHMAEQVYVEEIPLTECRQGEDRIFAAYIEPHLTNCNDKAYRIWQYASEEMINNAIEHSNGSRICIEVKTNVLSCSVMILDDGIGTFTTLLNYMKSHGWEEPLIEDALIELYKGKITSKEANHSGEGIFFSSKMMDDFCLWSDSHIYKAGYGKSTQTIQSHLLAYKARIDRMGTLVCMTLENETERNIVEVFDMYTDVDEGFIKTQIPVKEACISGEPVARSQARRICNRLDMFQEAVLDFTDVVFMGQGFADELFRVYAAAHPQIKLYPINMLPEVSRMIRHVGRGNLPENVCLSTAGYE